MPEFILPAEADRCPHCNAVLYDPPNCCEEAQRDYDHYMYLELEQRPVCENCGVDTACCICYNEEAEESREWCDYCGSYTCYCDEIRQMF